MSNSTSLVSADESKPKTLRAANEMANPGSTTPARPASSKTSAGGNVPVVRDSACQGSVYQKPTALPTATLPSGVTVQKSSEQTYKIYGDTTSSLRYSIQNCLVRKQSAREFHALTGYNITWQYTPTANSDATCSLADVKVAINLSQYLPTSDSQNSDWLKYASAIRNHEDGHININLVHANSLYKKLTLLSQVDCATLSALANETVQSQLSMLANENEIYDSSTGHGATQGALL